jgi:hypothetical protein
VALITMEEKVEKMFTDLYIGEDRDNPSFATRLAITESVLEKISKNLNKALWLGVVAIVGVVLNALKSLILK